MKQIIKVLLLAALLLGLLSACATAQGVGNVEHGFYVDNKGDEPIHSVLISYGNLRLPFCDIRCLPKRGGGGWNAPMPIQEEMQVTWQTADGKTHEARVPVRAKVKDMSRLATLYLQFNGAQLTVVQALHDSNPTILEFEKLPLYP